MSSTLFNDLPTTNPHEDTDMYSSDESDFNEEPYENYPFFPLMKKYWKSKTLAERLEFIKTNADEIISRNEQASYLYTICLKVRKRSEIVKIVRCFRDTFGPFMCCYSASYSEQRICTLFDYVRLTYGSNDFKEVYHYLLVELENSGCYGSADCNQFDLLTEFYSLAKSAPWNLPIWQMCSFITQFKYSYEEMRSNRSPIKEGLAMYLYHPDRIRDWLAKNPDKHVEDYEP